MVLKFTYNKEDGRLESYQNYTIAQNSSLTNTIVVTSTDHEAQDYDYYLEFVCYNHQNLPKAQYISPVLEYTDNGIFFVIPAELTQYRGHVDMQLSGYSIFDDTQVFKSINKGAKAFDVEGSLSVMEREIANTPNIFTEFFQEVELYRKTRDEIAENVKQDTEQKVASVKQEVDEMGDSIKQDIEEMGESILQEAESVKEELAQSVRQQVLDSLQGILPNNSSSYFYKVTFRVNGEIIKSMSVGEGKTLVQPEYTLPSGCEVIGGWYDLSKDKLWDFAEDTVQEDVTLTLNFMSSGIGFASNGKIKNFANLTGDIYLPDFYNGQKITHVDSSVINLSDNVNLHFGYNITNYLGVLNKGNKVKYMYFPKDSKMHNRSNGVYTDKDMVGMVSFIFAPRNNEEELYIQSDCQQLGVYAISNNPNLKKIVIPPTVTGLNSSCIINTGITSLTIPSSVTYCNTGAVLNNSSLKSVYLESDLSSNITEGTFVDTTKTPSARPTLYVRPEHYENYCKYNMHNFYTIKIMGKEYLDNNYEAKSETLE